MKNLIVVHGINSLGNSDVFYILKTDLTADGIKEMITGPGALEMHELICHAGLAEDIFNSKNVSTLLLDDTVND